MKLFAFHKKFTTIKVYIDGNDFVFTGMKPYPIYKTIWYNNNDLKGQLAIRLEDMGYNVNDFEVLE